MEEYKISYFLDSNGDLVIKYLFELNYGDMFAPVENNGGLQVGMVVPLGKYYYQEIHGNCIDLLSGKPDYIAPDTKVRIVNKCCFERKN